MPKKTAATKKRTATTTAKRGPGRPPGSKNKTSTTTTAKKPAAKKTTQSKQTQNKNVKNVKKPAGKRGGFNREINEDTGFVVGTDQDTIALELLEGGESRAEIAERLEGMLDPVTRNGTEKQVPNMIGGVLGKMLERGFTVESSFVVIPPTPASKRAATRKANSKKKK